MKTKDTIDLNTDLFQSTNVSEYEDSSTLKKKAFEKKHKMIKEKARSLYNVYDDKRRQKEDHEARLLKLGKRTGWQSAHPLSAQNSSDKRRDDTLSDD